LLPQEREDAGRFIVHADDISAAFLKIQPAIHRELELGSSAVSESALRVFEIGAVFT
jgi:hypothetical protein